MSALEKVKTVVQQKRNERVCELYIGTYDHRIYFLYNFPDKNVFHVSSAVSGYTRKYKVDNVPQHDYWADEFSFQGKRSMTNDKDVMAFTYAPFPGRSPVNSVAFVNDASHLPLDYFVAVKNASVQYLYIKNLGSHMYPEIGRTDKSANCCPSPANTTSWLVHNISLTGK